MSNTIQLIRRGVEDAQKALSRSQKLLEEYDATVEEYNILVLGGKQRIKDLIKYEEDLIDEYESDIKILQNYENRSVEK